MAVTEVEYRARGAAAELWDCIAPEVQIEGPGGSGKTRAVLEKINALCETYPGTRALICRATRVSCTESILVTLERDVLRPEMPGMQRTITRGQRDQYEYENSSVIVVGGLDNPDRLFSTEWDVVYVAEAVETSLDAWEKFARAMRSKAIPMGLDGGPLQEGEQQAVDADGKPRLWHQRIADCNPGAPTHWLNQRCNAGLMVRLLSRHSDNPSVTSDYLAGLDALTGVRRDRLFLGKWVQAEGVVYQDFDPAVHVIDRAPVPLDWPRYRLIDFGFNAPFCCQWWARTPDLRVIRYRELYETGRILVDPRGGYDLVKEITELSVGERFVVTLPDPEDAEGCAALQRAGMNITLPNKSVELGIQAHMARLRKDATGKPRMMFMKGSLVRRDPVLSKASKPCCTEEEYPEYVYPPGKDGKPVKEIPVDENNHGLDLCRYLSLWLDLYGGGNFKVSRTRGRE